MVTPHFTESSSPPSPIPSMYVPDNSAHQPGWSPGSSPQPDRSPFAAVPVLESDSTSDDEGDSNPAMAGASNLLPGRPRAQSSPLDDSCPTDNNISEDGSPTLAHLELFRNLVVPRDKQYQYDAELNGGNASKTCKNNGFRATAEYLCSYPGVSWNTRMQSWLVYYEDINGRKSKTFNPKRYPFDSLDSAHPFFNTLRFMSPMEIAMHHACAFAAEVRYRAKVIKSYGYKAPRSRKLNSVNSLTALVCRNSVDQETMGDTISTGRKTQRRVRRSRSFNPSSQISKSNGKNNFTFNSQMRNRALSSPSSNDNNYGLHQASKPHPSSHVVFPFGNTAMMSSMFGVNPYSMQRIHSRPVFQSSGYYGTADCDMHTETAKGHMQDKRDCGSKPHSSSHGRPAANSFAVPFSFPPYANITITPSLSESALNLSKDVVMTPESKSPFRASLRRSPAMSHQADVQSHHQTVAQKNQPWSSTEKLNSEAEAKGGYFSNYFSNYFSEAAASPPSSNLRVS